MVASDAGAEPGGSVARTVRSEPPDGQARSATVAYGTAGRPSAPRTGVSAAADEDPAGGDGCTDRGAAVLAAPGIRLDPDQARCRYGPVDGHVIAGVGVERERRGRARLRVVSGRQAGRDHVQDRRFATR